MIELKEKLKVDVIRIPTRIGAETSVRAALMPGLLVSDEFVTGLKQYSSYSRVDTQWSKYLSLDFISVDNVVESLVQNLDLDKLKHYFNCWQIRENGGYAELEYMNSDYNHEHLPILLRLIHMVNLDSNMFKLSVHQQKKNYVFRIYRKQIGLEHQLTICDNPSLWETEDLEKCFELLPEKWMQSVGNHVQIVVKGD